MFHLGWFSNAPKQTLSSRCSQWAGALWIISTAIIVILEISYILLNLECLCISEGKLFAFHLQHKGEGLAAVISSTYKHEDNNPNSGFWRCKKGKYYAQTGKPTKYIHCLTGAFIQNKAKKPNCGIISLGVFFMTFNSLFSQRYLEKEE